MSNIKSSANELLNGTLVNISNKMNSTYNNNNNIKRVHSSSKGKIMSNVIDNNISFIHNKNKRYQNNSKQNKNNYIKSANKNIQKNESDNLNKSPKNEIDVVMIKNGKNYYNVNISNIYKEKEKNMCYSKKDKIDCGINSKNEIWL